MMDDINACGEEDIKGKVNNSAVRHATAQKNKNHNSFYHDKTPKNHSSSMAELNIFEANEENNQAQSYTERNESGKSNKFTFEKYHV